MHSSSVSSSCSYLLCTGSLPRLELPPCHPVQTHLVLLRGQKRHAAGQQKHTHTAYLFSQYEAIYNQPVLCCRTLQRACLWSSRELSAHLYQTTLKNPTASDYGEIGLKAFILQSSEGFACCRVPHLFPPLAGSLCDGSEYLLSAPSRFLMKKWIMKIQASAGRYPVAEARECPLWIYATWCSFDGSFS